MSRIKDQVYSDYYGHLDEDATAQYHNNSDTCMEHPVGDLFDDDNFWQNEEQ
jgi:hypothetical protein